MDNISGVTGKARQQHAAEELDTASTQGAGPGTSVLEVPGKWSSESTAHFLSRTALTPLKMTMWTDPLTKLYS